MEVFIKFGVAVVTSAPREEKKHEEIEKLEKQCYKELVETVQGIAGALDVNVSSIMNMIALRVMSQQMPETEEAMLKIPHVTKANFDKYGKVLLETTQKYAAEKYGWFSVK